jgi:hypothetical protein
MSDADAVSISFLCRFMLRLSSLDLQGFPDTLGWSTQHGLQHEDPAMPSSIGWIRRGSQ